MEPSQAWVFRGPGSAGESGNNLAEGDQREIGGRQPTVIATALAKPRSMIHL